MRLTFRAEILLVVGTTALAFVLVILVGAWTGGLTEVQMKDIEDRYVPILELGPRLENELERTRRGLLDAVAAQDLEALERTRTSKERFLALVNDARGVFPAEDSAALTTIVTDWYDTSLAISRRIIAGETGEQLVNDMAEMQAKQRQAEVALERATTFDRGELHGAFERVRTAQETADRIRLVISLVAFVLVLTISLWITRRVLRALAELMDGFSRFGEGAFDRPIRVFTRDELGDVARHANRMAQSLRQLSEQRDATDWLKTGQSRLAAELQGDLTVDQLAARAITFLARYTGAPAGAFYVADGEELRLAAGYSHPDAGAPVLRFRRGEGIVGQALVDRELRVLRDVPPSYLHVRSGLGGAAPAAILLLPLVKRDDVAGVVELALMEPPSERLLELARSSAGVLAIALDVARIGAARKLLLEETQQQAAMLADQEDELRRTNEELESQQEELRQSNEELLRQTEELEAQRRELGAVSSYKSQFLANMSHELRTPLNSMLLLSGMLADNESGRLTDKEMEFARTIHAAGKELLALINQVLDLARIEARKLPLHLARFELTAVASTINSVHSPVAGAKGVALEVTVAPGTPERIHSDRQRVEQILTNLVGNAIKFTSAGRVALRIERSRRRFPARSDLPPESTIAFLVEDTGIGIDPAHAERIFAPFEQVDGMTDRRYGGTGLGLAIARELTRLLGGELTLESTPGRGSTFALYLSEEPGPAVLENASEPVGPAAPQRSTRPPTPRSTIFRPRVRRERPALLIIEDDASFASVVAEIAGARGLEVHIAHNAETGLALARAHLPDGIILDVQLPDVDGFVLLERLRAGADTRHIPVHFVSALEGDERSVGATGYLTKPVSRDDLVHAIEKVVPATQRPRRVLVVEDDATLGDSLVHLIREQGIEAERAGSARAALEALARTGFGCMILDLGLPDMDGMELLELLGKRRELAAPPAVIYTGRALSKEEATRLGEYAQSIVLKEGSSEERVLQDTRLFLETLADSTRPGVAEHAPELRLEGKKILVADDDMRTVYALSALLRGKGADVLVADSGRSALEVLSKNRDVAAVLIDIMMPEIDGYETIRRIRAQARYTKLPIIALTAKAMRPDRDKCIEAGASDYLAKPIEGGRLLRLLHAWLEPRTGP